MVRFSELVEGIGGQDNRIRDREPRPEQFGFVGGLCTDPIPIILA
jgi:hypothetical protein